MFKEKLTGSFFLAEAVNLTINNGCNCVIQQPSATALKQSVKDRLGPLITANSEPSQDSSTDSQVCVLMWCYFSFFFQSKCAQDSPFCQADTDLTAWISINKASVTWRARQHGSGLLWDSVCYVGHNDDNDPSCLPLFISLVRNLHQSLYVHFHTKVIFSFFFSLGRILQKCLWRSD